MIQPNRPLASPLMPIERALCSGLASCATTTSATQAETAARVTRGRMVMG